MAYIDREQLLELINKDCKYKNPTNEYTRGCNEVCDWAIKTIKNIPISEVVPKSEAEELKVRLELEQKAHESLKELYRIDTGALVEARRKTEVEVASEIFEEIYETMNSVYASVQHSCVGMHGDNPETMRLLGKLEGIKHLGDEIAEFKKKYTEDGK